MAFKVSARGVRLRAQICACNVRPTKAAVVHGPAALICAVESARPVVADQLGLRGLILLPGMHLARVRAGATG